jgi:hypothetical protein
MSVTWVTSDVRLSATSPCRSLTRTGFGQFSVYAIACLQQQFKIDARHGPNALVHDGIRRRPSNHDGSVRTVLLDPPRRSSCRIRRAQPSMRKELTVRRATFAFLVAASFCLTAFGALAQAARPPQPCTSSVRYGENALAGQRATVNGISMYYETYGKGPPLLLIHGNGGSIDAMRCQIEHFRDLPPIFSPGIMRLSPVLGSPTLHLQSHSHHRTKPRSSAQTLLA